ncbi:MAG: BatD family protein, partial [Candidatus Omnitrophica bacterium]|nr:BatD family protein [Candidatus Omnitrophota bacterium]
MVKKVYLKIVLFFAGITVLSSGLFPQSSARAADLSFEATVDKTEVSLGDAVRLTLTINGTQNAAQITLPDMEGFDVRFLGPNRRVSIVNGQYSSSIAYVYSLFPLKVGTYTIPALNLSMEGQTLSSDAIEIQVVDQATNASSQTPSTQGSLSIRDKIFVKLQVPKNEVYLNQKLPVKIFLYVSSLTVRDINYPVFETLGYQVDEFLQPRQFEQI